MEEIKYLRWQDYYKNTWLNDYDNMQKVIKDESKSKLDILKSFNKFWSSTIFLLQTYIRNYGQYYNGNTMVIKISFRCGFIIDGDTWILMNDMVLNYKKYSMEEALKILHRELDEKMRSNGNRFPEVIEIDLSKL